ncbi:hypothetical protein DLN00_25945, partial [Salmonella enterica subsp. enterica serovar Newport str. CFSAN000828]
MRLIKHNHLWLSQKHYNYDLLHFLYRLCTDSLLRYQITLSDRFKIKITGSGGHASAPQNSKDPTLAACHLILALQSIVSRNTDPQQSVVISVGSIIAGNDESYNIIPEQVEILLSVRTLNKNVRKQTIKRNNEIIEHCS